MGHSEVIRRRRHVGRYWGAKFVALALGLLTEAVGIVIAAALLEDVSTTVTAAALAGAVVTVPLWVHGLVEDDFVDRAESDDVWVTVIAVFTFTGFLMPIPLLVTASAIVSGFDVEGFSGYASTWLLTLAVGFALLSPYWATRFLRHKRRTARPS